MGEYNKIHLTKPKVNQPNFKRPSVFFLFFANDVIFPVIYSFSHVKVCLIMFSIKTYIYRSTIKKKMDLTNLCNIQRKFKCSFGTFEFSLRTVTTRLLLNWLRGVDA